MSPEKEDPTTEATDEEVEDLEATENESGEVAGGANLTYKDSAGQN